VVVVDVSRLVAQCRCVVVVVDVSRLVVSAGVLWWWM